MKLNKMEIKSMIMYRPPGNASPRIFTAEFDSAINKISKKYNLLIMGDFNIDLLKSNNDSSQYLDQMNASGLENCNEKYPRRVDLKNETKTNNDHILARFKICAISTPVIECDISDLYCAINLGSLSETTTATNNAKYYLKSTKVKEQI